MMLCFAAPALCRGEAAAPALPDGYNTGLDLNGVLSQANEHYTQGDLDKALDGYLYLLGLGIRNGYLYYNLGNTYFRLGNLGDAILWYERALQLIPRHHDLLVNYVYARNQLADEEFQQAKYGGTVDLLRSIHHYLNMRESLLCALGAFWLWTMSILARWQMRTEAARGWLRIPCWTLGIAFILLSLSASWKIYDYERAEEAVVMTQAVDIKTGPNADMKTAFTLHEGAKVNKLREQGGWARISLPGNSAFNGWLPKEAIETI